MRPVVVVLALAACGRSPGVLTSGEMSVQWAGSDTGAFRAGATAWWCARDSLLEVYATRNDTAVGFTLLPPDTVVAGAYSVLSTEIFIALRPQAGLALRYLDPTELKWFEGASGGVTVSEVGPKGVSGSFEASLRRLGTPDTLRLSGRFAGVPIGPAPAGCGRANRPQSG